MNSLSARKYFIMNGSGKGLVMKCFCLRLFLLRYWNYMVTQKAMRTCQVEHVFFESRFAADVD